MTLEVLFMKPSINWIQKFILRFLYEIFLNHRRYASRLYKKYMFSASIQFISMEKLLLCIFSCSIVYSLQSDSKHILRCHKGIQFSSFIFSSAYTFCVAFLKAFILCCFYFVHVFIVQEKYMSEIFQWITYAVKMFLCIF